MRECAYCNESGDLTSEHLLPQAFLRRMEEYTTTYLEAAQRMLSKNWPTIRDVCARCNNGPLSELDKYACELHDQYFSSFVTGGQTVHFCYSFSKLSRWLLKVSYNSARANKSADAEVLCRMSHYILNGGRAPQRMRLRLQLIVPYKLKPDDRESLPEELQDLEEFPPMQLRVSRQHDTRAHTTVLVRRVAINSYHFWLTMPRRHLSRAQWRREVRQVESLLPGSHLLSSNSPRAKINASGIDTISSYDDTALEQFSVWEKWLATLES